MIRGFWLNTWLDDKFENDLDNIKTQIKQNYPSIFKSQISKTYKLEQLNEALQYQ